MAWDVYTTASGVTKVVSAFVSYSTDILNDKVLESSAAVNKEELLLEAGTNGFSIV